MPNRTPPPAAPGPTDTVAAMLTPGEYVMNRNAVRRIGVENLNRLNQGVRGYQEGGTVTQNPPPELPPPGMAPGLGTVGGAPDASAKSTNWKPTDDPSVVSLKPAATAKPEQTGWKPTDDPSVVPFKPSATQSAKPEQTGWKPTNDPSVVPLKPAATPPETTTWKPTDDSSVVPLPQQPPQSQLPSQFQTPPAPPAQPEPAAPMPSGTGAGAPQGSVNQSQQPQLVTDPESGTRYVVDPGTGQKVPYAELATPADKAAQPPDATLLPKVTVQPPAQQTTTSMPSGTGAAANQPVATDPQIQLQALIASGKTPGEAQAIVNGQPPKTLNGSTPAPKQPAQQRTTPIDNLGTLGDEGLINQALTDTPQQKPQVQPSQTQSSQAQPSAAEQAEKQYVETEKAKLAQQPPAAPTSAAPTTPAPTLQPDTSGKDNTGVADFFRKRGDQPITSAQDPRLTTVSAGDQKWQVNKEAAPYFQGFLSELKANGAPVKTTPGGPSGWVYREKVGAKGISEHAFGGAIDINQTGRNTVTPEFQKWIAAHPNVLQEAEKHWHIYGGERFGDLGHFEWGGVPSSTTTDQKPEIIGGNRLYGTSTVFGLNYDGSVDTQDNGRGIFGANTRNPKLRGVAVPVDVLEKTFGHAFQPDGQGGYSMVNTPEAKKVIQAIQSAHVELPDANGKMHSFPIIDIQGSLKGHPGKVLDMTLGAAKEMGFNDNHAVSYQIIGGDGKPYPIPETELTGGGGEKGGKEGTIPAGEGDIGLVPVIPTIPPSGSVRPSGGSPQLPGPSGGGVPSQGGGGQSDAGRFGIDLADIASGALLANAMRGGGQQPQPRPPQPASPEEEQNPMVAALMQRGFTQQQAVQFAQSSQTVTPGKGIGPLQGPPPPAPSGGPTQQLVTPKLLSAKELMPGKVPKIGPSGKPPPAAPGKAPATPTAQLPTQAAPTSSRQPPPPPAPGTPSQRPPVQTAVPTVDPSVVAGLMRRGFTRQQAEAFAAKATVTKPQTGGATFRPQAGGTSAPMQEPPPAAPGKASRPQKSAEPAPYEGAPEASTHGIPNPEGMDALEGLPLSKAVKAHAGLLSPDDPRVKKQRDGMIKGEHFVEGDPAHDQLLDGLPGGRNGRQRAILAQAEQAIADKNPMHISYLSAPKEAEKFPTRDSRKIQYDAHSPEARLLGTTEAQLVGHSFIPISVGVKLPAKAGEPHESYLQGMSTHVLANNVQHLNAKLAEMGQKSPYPQLGPKFSNDLEGYISNLNAGHTGTGRGYAAGTAEYPNTPDENHVPYKLTRREADFLNAAINNTAAFAKHEDGQALRRLAEANGTQITPQGETNRIRHEIEQHEPGWRQKVLEPTIRSFKTGLIQQVHPSEGEMPEAIRPGKEYQDLTRAIARTSYRGRPDVPLSVSPRSQPSPSIPRDLAHNQLINRIEREFSEDKINEAEARKRLHAIGENPDEYRFVGGSGGLVSPYESDGEQITAEEHAQLKDALRKKWLGGGLDIENYRRRIAEVPLPEKPSAPAQQTSTPLVASPPKSKPAPKSSPPPTDTEPEDSEPKTPQEAPEAPTGPIPAPVKPKPVKAVPEEPEKEPTQSMATPPAPDEPLPVQKTAKAKTPVVAPQEEEELTYKEMSPAQKEAYVAGRVKDRLANQIKGAVKLRPALEDDGSYSRDDAGNPQWEKNNYDLVNSPILGNKRLDRAKDQKFKDQEDIYGENEHTHLNDIDRKRLSYLEQKSAVDTMADKIVNNYHTQMKNIPEVAAASGWYSRMRDKLKKAFGPDAEIFAQLLGATSARTGVRQNFIQSLDAYDQLKNGNFDNHIAKYNEAHEHLAKGEGALAKHMRDSGILDQMRTNGTLRVDKKTGEMVEPKTDAAAMADWIEHHNILPRQKNGQKFNANSNQVLKVLAQKWLQSVKAPKTPNFAGNLSGRTLESTIDVWSARYLHELGNEGNKKPWMLQPGGEGGVRGLDFAYSQRAFRKAADRLGIEPDDAQAIAWYYQKHLWDARGHTKGQGAKKASFDQTFDRIFRPSGERMTDEEARQAFAGEQDEPEEEEEAA